MKALLLILYLIWVFALLKLLTPRSVLPSRVQGMFLLVGMLIGPVAVTPLLQLADPYFTLTDPLYNTLLHLLSTLALFAPVFVYFFKKGLARISSVTDVFLAAFWVGAGFDLFGLAQYIQAGELSFLSQLGLLPPWTMDAYPSVAYFGPVVDEVKQAARIDVPGIAYHCALLGLAIALGERLKPGKWLAAALALVCLAYFGLDSFMASQIPNRADEAPATVWETIWIWQRRLYPWFCLAALAVASLWESKRLAATDNAFLAQAKKLWTFLKTASLRNAIAWERERRQVAQTAIVENELSRDENNSALLIAQSRLQSEDTAQAPGPLPKLDFSPAGSLLAKKNLYFLLWAVAILLLLVRPSEIASSLFAFGVLAANVWANKRPHPKVSLDQLSEAYGLRFLMILASVAAILALASALPDVAYPNKSFLWAISQQIEPSGLMNVPLPLPVVALLALALAAASLSLKRSHLFRPPPAANRSGHYASKAGNLSAWLAIGLVCSHFYVIGLQLVHKWFGAEIYYIASGEIEQAKRIPNFLSFLELKMQPPFGNTFAAWIFGTFCAALGILLLSQRKRIEALFTRLWIRLLHENHQSENKEET